MFRVKHITIFREEATSTFAGFRLGRGRLSWLNSNLDMLVSVKRGKPENLPKKSSKRDEKQQHTQPTSSPMPELNPGNILVRQTLSSLRHRYSL